MRHMKLIKRNISTFIILLTLFIAIGTLSWELLERILASAGLPIDWTVGPVSLDVRVLKLELMVNPGTIIGTFFGFRVFHAA